MNAIYQRLSMRLVSILACILVIWPVMSWNMAAAEPLHISDLRSGQLENASRLVIETSDPVPVRMLLLVDPHRLVIDFPESRWRVENRGISGALSAPLINSYRYGVPAPNISRLVFDLDGPAVPEQIFWLPPRDGRHRLVIDLADRGETSFRVVARALLDNQNLSLPSTSAQTANVPNSQTDNRTASASSVPIPIKRPPPPILATTVSAYSGQVEAPADRPVEPLKAERKWIVFIDPGHGGKDPGAISLNGHKEKDIVLMAARELARQLEATGQVRAIMSRNSDKFLHLRKRIELARLHQADIFISIHADAARSAKARGVSVFTLSDKASDKEAAYLASRENKADLVGGPDLGATDPEITPALLSIFQREAMNQSSELAHQLIREFDGLPTLDRGHRFAGFAVLKSPDIPSVLIEMGFLTNSQDERYLTTESYRKEIMLRVTRAVLTFLENNEDTSVNIPLAE